MTWFIVRARGDMENSRTNCGRVSASRPARWPRPGQVDDDYGTEVYRERLHYLRQVVLRHRIQPPACPEPAACSVASGGQR